LNVGEHPATAKLGETRLFKELAIYTDHISSETEGEGSYGMATDYVACEVIDYIIECDWEYLIHEISRPAVRGDARRYGLTVASTIRI
jgi:hypothetical protein